MLFERAYAVPHVLSLLIATAFLFAALRRPLLARKLYLGLFVYAALVNATVCVVAPESYVDNARYALLPWYRTFILGWFAEHVRLMVASIALGQACIALGLTLGAPFARPALVGAVVFFLAIAPLGVGSAFPSTLLWAFGAGFLLLSRRVQPTLAASLWPRFISHRRAVT